MKRGFVLVLCGLVSYPFTAFAGFNEALTAYQSKDFSKAINEAREAATAGDPRGSFLLGVAYQNGQGVPANSTEAAAWYEKAAQGGVAGSFSKLAQLYARGDGVPKNMDKAIALARLGDKAGDVEGTFFLHVSLSAGPLSQLDGNGKPDNAKYQKLATRPVSDRTLDVESKDALYRSAAKGYPLAQMTLALALGGTVGDGNRERMLALVSKIPNHTNQALKNYEKIARHMEHLGQTYTSPQLFFDAQTSQTLAGMIQTCGIRDPKEAEKPAPPELTAIAISKPLSGAIFLPSSIAGNEHAYLVAGEWEENWTYRGCGNTGNVTVNFTADGMGGAYMTSKQTPKVAEKKQQPMAGQTTVALAQTPAAPPSDFVPIGKVQIASRFITVDVTRETLGIEANKCIPQLNDDSQNIKKEVNDFPNKNIVGLSHASSANMFLMRQTKAVCLQRSSEQFPIFAAEALLETVNPKGVPPDVVDGWYKQIALLIATKGVAKVAYVYANGNANVVSYWVETTPAFGLYYSSTFNKVGTWETETFDAQFSHPSMSSISETKRSGLSQKSYPMAHRTM